VKSLPQELHCSKPLLNIRQRGSKLSHPEGVSDSETQFANVRGEDQVPECDDDDKMLVVEGDGSPSSYKNRYMSSSNEEFERPHRSGMTTMMESINGTQKEPRGLTKPEPLPSPANADYHPASAYLPLAQGEFLFLSLAPGSPKDEIIASFVTASIGNLPMYTAISYLCDEGQQNSVKITLLDAQHKPHSVYIRANLHAVLRNLRYRFLITLLWVDTLCLQRSSTENTNNDFAMKRFIFRNAQDVCVWLGEENPSFNAAFNFLPHILDVAGIDELLRNEETIAGWLAFVALLKNPIFSRLCLIQELAPAQNVMLHAGHQSTRYLDFVDAMSIFLTCRLQISKLLRSHNVDPKDLFDHKITMTERFGMLTTKALRKTAAGKIQRQYTLESLVLQTRGFLVSNPLDRIYSLLALAKDFGETYDAQMISNQDNFPAIPLRIDYDRNLSDVYRDFVVHVIETTRSLDIICRQWTRRVNADLPTYIRPLSSSELHFEADASDNEKADGLLGPPGHRYYSASQGTVATYSIGLRPIHQRASIILNGFRVDRIQTLGPRAIKGFIPREWLNLGGCSSQEDLIGEIPEDFWRTLVADRGPGGSVTPSWYYRAFEHCLSNRNPNGDINIARLIAESEAGSSLVTEFLSRVQNVICDRKLLVSMDHKWFGLVPDGTEIGDIICILCGCSVPVILREGSGDDTGCWRLVGECYVHGIMDGEITEAHLTSGIGEFESFELI
jgi:hypothetical protein